MLRATLKSLLSRKLRLILSGLAVVLGVMFVSGAFVLTDTLSRSFDQLFTTVYSDTDVQVSMPPKVGGGGEFDEDEDAGSLPADVVARIQGVAGVAAADGLVSADGARLIGSDGKVVQSLGPPRLGTNWQDGGLATIRPGGRAPAADNEIVVNAALAESARVEVGDQVSVLTLQPKRTFTLVGVFGYTGGQESLGGTQVVAFTTPVAQELMLGEKNVFSAVSVRAGPDVTPEVLRDRIAGALGPGYSVNTGQQLADAAAAGFAEGLAFFNNILLGFAGVALFVGIFIILNTFSIIVAQRTRELALTRALGASRRQVVGSVLVEAVVIGLIASALGLGAGIGVGALLANLFGSIGGGLELAGIGVPPAAIIGAFGVGLVVTVVAALLPAIRASRVAPVAALQEAATPDRSLTRLTVAGTLVAAAGGTLLALGLTDNAGDETLWTILGGVLLTFIGVALLTPFVARPVVGLIGRLFSWSVPGKLGRLNSGRNPRRTAITASALMVGIALVTGINTIFISVERSFAKTTGEQVKAELIISGEQSGERPPTFDPGVLTGVAALPGVESVVAGYAGEAQMNGDRTRVTAVTDVALMRDLLSLKVTSGQLDSLSGRQLVIDSDVAGEHRLQVGDDVTVQLSRGAAETYTVAGVFTGTDLVRGWFLPEPAVRNFAVRQPTTAFIKVTDATDPEQVRADVARLLADSPEVGVSNQADYIAAQTNDIDTVLMMVQILLALAILIAVLGIVNTLALSVLERTRELGLLRAVGLRRGQTMWMVTVEAMVISVFGAVLGLAVGAGLGIATVRALSDQGISELALPWAQMGVYLGLALVVGVLAAILPAIRAARVNVLAAIAYE